MNDNFLNELYIISFRDRSIQSKIDVDTIISSVYAGAKNMESDQVLGFEFFLLVIAYCKVIDLQSSGDDLESSYGTDNDNREILHQIEGKLLNAFKNVEITW